LIYNNGAADWMVLDAAGNPNQALALSDNITFVAIKQNN
jgi:hypothetical protein